MTLKNPDEIFKSLIGISHFPHGIFKNPVGIFIEVKNQSTTVDVIAFILWSVALERYCSSASCWHVNKFHPKTEVNQCCLSLPAQI
jgi:hypothetical protein